MAIVIDGLTCIQTKKRLPLEAFFVDTNIIIYYKDPFSQSRFAKQNEEVTEVLEVLKSSGIKFFSTVSVAVEYYKHIQVNFYLIQQLEDNPKFETSLFKKRRDTDVEFMVGWDLQIKNFSKVFRKTFPLYLSATPKDDILSIYKGSEVDFGDHALYSTVMNCDVGIQGIFSNDSDFYSYPDTLYLLTTNPNIVSKAKKDDKLY